MSSFTEDEIEFMKAISNNKKPNIAKYYDKNRSYNWILDLLDKIGIQ
jgi:hypothetical protein